MPRPKVVKCSSTHEDDEQHDDRTMTSGIGGPARSRSVARSVQFAGKSVTALVPSSADRDAAEQRQGADRDRQRRQPDVRDQEAVERTADHADQRARAAAAAGIEQPGSGAGRRAARC